MQLENRFTVAAPIDEAWRVLLDIDRVAKCMPGATLDSVDGDEFTGRVKVKVGPIVITYQGSARFVEKDEGARRAVIDASGKESRGSGTAKATVTTDLVARGEETDVHVVTDLNITGRPAQFGRGVIADVAGSLTAKFADALAAELAGSEEGGPGEGAVAATDTTAPRAASGSSTDHRPAGAHAERSENDAIDLLGVSAGPALKRLAPVLAALGALALAMRLRRRRRARRQS